jgi:hypothetical protein
VTYLRTANANTISVVTATGIVFGSNAGTRYYAFPGQVVFGVVSPSGSGEVLTPSESNLINPSGSGSVVNPTAQGIVVK